MRILILTIGTMGDVAPYTGLAVRLRQDGHHVAIATHERLAGPVRACGIEFRPLSGDPEALLASESSRNSTGRSGFARMRQMRRLSRSLIPGIARDALAAAERGTDLLLVAAPVTRVGYLVGEALGVPSMGVLLLPASPTGDFPPVISGSRSLGRWGNRVAGQIMSAVADREYEPILRRLRSEFGLPVTGARPALHRRGCDWPLRYAFSPIVLPRPGDWDPGWGPVGFLWPARAAGWEPDASLADFLAAGPPPIGVSFGSAFFTDRERLAETVLTAVRAAGARAVIQSGWQGLQACDNDDVLTVGEVPHDWLFPRLSTVVHASGVGTAAASLRAGVPSVAVPVRLDQPFWAGRLATLGVSPPPISARHLTAPRLTTALRQAAEHRQRATELAGHLADEDGAGHLARTIARL
ncbi:glycosyltransferase [Amycolatopsis sp. PS_44_ISF1]|uniref:glycosyltransferase n=1 Tax=Amycolatopsis sp. PS_44_ISF1 TaxID=2974917 RepID=UPI0028DF2775|nr:glycosyltransferase [Amycolatopsis sp. PS_44_ISF1]MDT8914664.1 glycosyltransferase [Amycolatopsis sp. PS_44_ISF1]